MDNQQESSAIAWLAGIWEGEGYISLQYRPKKQRGQSQHGFIIQPMAEMVNTDTELVEACHEILSAANVGHYIKKYAGTKRWKPRYNVIVWGAKRCGKLITTLLPHLRGRKRRVALLCERYIESRLSNAKNAPYTQREVWLFASVRKLNETSRTHKETSRKVAEILRDYTPDPNDAWVMI